MSNFHEPARRAAPAQRRARRRWTAFPGVAAALATVTLAAGCGITTGSTTPTTPAPVAVASPAPAALHGAQAQAARAVDVFDQALQSGDIAQLCRPGGIFTAEVVAALNSGDGCEASLEQSSVLDTPPTLIVTGLTYKGDLATAQVDGGAGTAIPLDLVRDGRRWLVSFSDGIDPITALEQ